MLDIIESFEWAIEKDTWGDAKDRCKEWEDRRSSIEEWIDDEEEIHETRMEREATIAELLSTHTPRQLAEILADELYCC